MATNTRKDKDAWIIIGVIFVVVLVSIIFVAPIVEEPTRYEVTGTGVYHYHDTSFWFPEEDYTECTVTIRNLGASGNYYVVIEVGNEREGITRHLSRGEVDDFSAKFYNVHVVDDFTYIINEPKMKKSIFQKLIGD